MFSFHITNFLRVTGITVAILLPIATRAAISPQKLLNASVESIKNVNDQTVANITFVDKTIRKQDNTFGDGRVRLRWSNREAPTGDKMHDTEGSFSLESLVSSGAGLPERGWPATIDKPLTLEWKSIGNASYIRFKEIPNAALNIFTSFVPSLPLYIGKWIALDLKDIGSLTTQEQQISDTTALLRGKPFLKVVKVESKKEVNGHTIWRIRAKANDAVIAVMEKEEIAALKKQKTLDKATRKSVKDKYANIRKYLKQTAFVAEVDEQTQTLQRMEIAGSATLSQTERIYNTRTDRFVNKSNGAIIIRYNGAINFLPADLSPIIAPADAVTLDQVLDETMKPTNTNAATSTGEM